MMNVDLNWIHKSINPIHGQERTSPDLQSTGVVDCDVPLIEDPCWHRDYLLMHWAAPTIQSHSDAPFNRTARHRGTSTRPPPPLRYASHYSSRGATLNGLPEPLDSQSPWIPRIPPSNRNSNNSTITTQPYLSPSPTSNGAP